MITLALGSLLWYAYTSFRLASTSFISCSIVIFPPVVERTKRCWDFCSTLFILDLILQYFVDRFPRSVSWWLSHVATLGGMIVLSEFFCAYFETLPIEAPGRKQGKSKHFSKKNEAIDCSTSAEPSSWELYLLYSLLRCLFTTVNHSSCSIVSILDHSFLSEVS